MIGTWVRRDRYGHDHKRTTLLAGHAGQRSEPENACRIDRTRPALAAAPGLLSGLTRAPRHNCGCLDFEREINGQSPAERLAIRRVRSKPLLDNLETWLREQRKKLSSKNPMAKAIDYALKRWGAFTRFLDDGRICLSNNAAERAVRGIAMAGSFCTSFVSVWKH